MRPRLLKSISHDDLHEVVDGGLDLQIFTNQNINFHLDVVVLIVHKIINRKRLVVGQIHQARSTHNFQIVLDPMLDHVVDSSN